MAAAQTRGPENLPWRGLRDFVKERAHPFLRCASQPLTVLARPLYAFDSASNSAAISFSMRRRSSGKSMPKARIESRI